MGAQGMEQSLRQHTGSKWLFAAGRDENEDAEAWEVDSEGVRYINFSSKRTRKRLAAGLRLDPIGGAYPQT